MKMIFSGNVIVETSNLHYSTDKWFFLSDG